MKKIILLTAIVLFLTAGSTVEFDDPYPPPPSTPAPTATPRPTAMPVSTPGNPTGVEVVSFTARSGQDVVKIVLTIVVIVGVSLVAVFCWDNRREK